MIFDTYTLIGTAIGLLSAGGACGIMLASFLSVNREDKLRSSLIGPPGPPGPPGPMGPIQGPMGPIIFAKEIKCPKKIEGEKKMATLHEHVEENGYGVKLTFKKWPKGKYFVPEARLATGEYAGTLYGCPEEDKPQGKIKSAVNSFGWIEYKKESKED